MKNTCLEDLYSSIAECLTSVLIIQLAFFAVFFSSYFNSLAIAQESQSQARIYVVDLQQVIDQSLLGKAARQKLQDKIKDSQVELEKKKVSINSLSTEITKQSTLLSADALAAKRESLEQLQREYSKLAQVEQQAIKKANQESLVSLVEKAEEVVLDLVKKEKLSYVVQKRPGVVAYVDPSYEITSKVVKLLDSSSPS